MPTKPPPPIVVEQVDRDFVADAYAAKGLPSTAKFVRRGEMDEDPFVQLAAAHRLTGRDEGMRRAAEALTQCIAQLQVYRGELGLPESQAEKRARAILTETEHSK